MRDPGTPGGDDRQGRRGGRRLAAPDGHARSMLPQEQYRSLLRLAALLTGDPVVAQAVVADAIVANAVVADAGAARPRAVAAGRAAGERLDHLQRLVVLRCRRAGRYRRVSARRTERTASDFARLPVVEALLALSRGAREAVVLTHYLELGPVQAAAIAGVSETLLRANLAAAMQALDDQLTALSLDS
jgi:DNA-directed RNA polymerase specialized sigma24 family protein